MNGNEKYGMFMNDLRSMQMQVQQQNLMISDLRNQFVLKLSTDQEAYRLQSIEQQRKEYLESKEELEKVRQQYYNLRFAGLQISNQPTDYGPIFNLQNQMMNSLGQMAAISTDPPASTKRTNGGDLDSLKELMSSYRSNPPPVQVQQPYTSLVPGQGQQRQYPSRQFEEYSKGVGVEEIKINDPEGLFSPKHIKPDRAERTEKTDKSGTKITQEGQLTGRKADQNSVRGGQTSRSTGLDPNSTARNRAAEAKEKSGLPAKKEPTIVELDENEPIEEEKLNSIEPHAVVDFTPLNDTMFLAVVSATNLPENANFTKIFAVVSDNDEVILPSASKMCNSECDVFNPVYDMIYTLNLTGKHDCYVTLYLLQPDDSEQDGVAILAVSFLKLFEAENVSVLAQSRNYRLATISCLSIIRNMQT